MDPDPRQDTWLLMKSPWPTVALSLLYVVVVTWWGPLFMRHREPVKGLRPVMMVYNACQVIFSTYIFWEVSKVKVFFLVYSKYIFSNIFWEVKGGHLLTLYIMGRQCRIHNLSYIKWTYT